MGILIAGVLILLGIHCVGMLAPEWRGRMVERLGLTTWKGLYAVIALIGLGVLIVGFGLARSHPVLLYPPAPWLRSANALLELLAFVLVVAAYVPRNHLKARIGHPMLLGVAIWAVGHLLVTGMLHDVVLFGAFLLWAVADFSLSRQRDRHNAMTYPAGSMLGDVITVAAGVIAWFIFAKWLHLLLIGRSAIG